MVDWALAAGVGRSRTPPESRRTRRGRRVRAAPPCPRSLARPSPDRGFLVRLRLARCTAQYEEQVAGAMGRPHALDV